MPITDRYERMLRSVPDVYAELVEIKAIAKSGSVLLDKAERSLEEVFNQAFVESATWSLEKYEEELDLSTDLTSSVETRRRKILVKQNNIKPANVKNLTDLVNYYVENNSAKIESFPTEYRLEIEIPVEANAERNNVFETIEKAKPAHFVAEFGSVLLEARISLLDDTYTFSVYYPDVGDLHGAANMLPYNADKIAFKDDSYQFPVKYEVTEAFVNMIIDVAKPADDSYDFIVDYQETNDMYTMDAEISYDVRKQKIHEGTYHYCVDYPVCGEMVAEGG